MRHPLRDMNMEEQRIRPPAHQEPREDSDHRNDIESTLAKIRKPTKSYSCLTIFLLILFVIFMMLSSISYLGTEASVTFSTVGPAIDPDR